MVLWCQYGTFLIGDLSFNRIWNVSYFNQGLLTAAASLISSTVHISSIVYAC